MLDLFHHFLEGRGDNDCFLTSQETIDRAHRVVCYETTEHLSHFLIDLLLGTTLRTQRIYINERPK